jgi:hypothetical protein
MMSTEVLLRPGDRFWLYSNGLVEWMKLAGEQSGKLQLFSAIHDGSRQALGESASRVVRGLESAPSDQGPQDAISLV